MKFFDFFPPYFERILTILDPMFIVKTLLVIGIPLILIFYLERKKTAISDFVLLVTAIITVISTLGIIYFKLPVMILAIIGVFLVFRKFFKEHLDIIFNGRNENNQIIFFGKPISRRLINLLLVTIILIACQYCTDFRGASDSRTFYLPYARITAEMQQFPVFQDIMENPHFANPPALTGILSLIYQIIPTTEMWLYSIPITLFYIGFLYICYIWIDNLDMNIPYELISLMILLSYYFVLICSSIYQESLLIFGVAIVCYGIYWYEKTEYLIEIEGNSFNAFYLIMFGNIITSLSKQSGIVILFISVFYYIEVYIRRRHRQGYHTINIPSKIWIASLISMGIICAWYLRNFYFYGNPFLPLFNSFTMNPEIKTLYEQLQYMVSVRPALNIIEESKYLFPFYIFLILTPIAILFRKKLDKIELRFYIYILFFFVIWYGAVWEKSVRYHFIWMPVALVYVGRLFKWLEMKFTIDIQLNTIFKKKFKVKAMFSWLTMALIGLSAIEIAYLNQYDYGFGQYDKMSQWWGENIGNGLEIRIFSDDEQILMWEHNVKRFSHKSLYYIPEFRETVKNQTVHEYLAYRLEVQYVVDYPWMDPWNYLVWEPMKIDPRFEIVYRDIWNGRDLIIYKVARDISDIYRRIPNLHPV